MNLLPLTIMSGLVGHFVACFRQEGVRGERDRGMRFVRLKLDDDF